MLFNNEINEIKFSQDESFSAMFMCDNMASEKDKHKDNQFFSCSSEDCYCYSSEQDFNWFNDIKDCDWDDNSNHKCEHPQQNKCYHTPKCNCKKCKQQHHDCNCKPSCNCNYDNKPHHCYPPPPKQPCECPVNLGDKHIDAQTDGKVIKFEVKINNLCPNKKFGLVATAYIVKCGKKVSVGQLYDIVRRNGCDCGCFTRCYKLVVAIPVCSNEKIFVDVFGNYIDC